MGAVRIGRTWGLALAITFVLSALWTIRAWADLSAGHLPDTDDLMRLQQVRDWMAGQAFADVSQHRMGLDGSMHWSRLADLGIAVWVTVLRVVLDSASAELWASILWPATLFFLYLGVSAGLAALVGTPEHTLVGLIVAALAFPAISMFLPGRIDHHGLQIILVLLLAAAVLRPPSARSGAVAGLSATASLAIGLETSPQCFVAMAALAIFGLRNKDQERARMIAFGVTIAGATLAWAVFVRPERGWCDGFTAGSTSATVAAGATFVAMGLFQHGNAFLRLAAVAVTAASCLALAWPSASICTTGPYGLVDPLLQRLWLNNVTEARGLFYQSPTIAISFGALPTVALVAAAWLWVRERRACWAFLAAMIGIGLLVALVQVRAAPLAAAFAAPVMARVIILARTRGMLRLVASWLASAGMIWSGAAHAIAPRTTAPQSAATCDRDAVINVLRRLPPGRVIAPIDLGPSIIAGTEHHALAAPYHRNNAGNGAVYRFWLAQPARARGIARELRADYIVVCGDAFGGVAAGLEHPDGMAALLAGGTRQDWMVRVPTGSGDHAVYRVLRDESQHR